MNWPASILTARERAAQIVRSQMRAPRRLGPARAEEATKALVSGAIEGAIQVIGPRKTYEILQPLIDAITESAIAEEIARGRPK